MHMPKSMRSSSQKSGQTPHQHGRKKPDVFVQTLDVVRKIPVGPVILLIIAIFLITYFDGIGWIQTEGPLRVYERCGDGMCSPTEYEYGTCAQDCPLVTATPTLPMSSPKPTLNVPVEIVLDYEDRNFGFSAVPQDLMLEGPLKRTGVQWIMVEANPANPDKEKIQTYLDEGFDVAIRLQLANANVGHEQVKDLARFFGSGVGPYVKYYIVYENVPDVIRPLRDALREGCPACQLVLEVNPKDLERAKTLATACDGPCFDAIGFQFYDNENPSLTSYNNLRGYADDLKSMLKKTRLSGMPLWMTGIGAYGGRFDGSKFRRDDQHAHALFKTLSFALANGFDKVFLANPAGCFEGEPSYFCKIGITDLNREKPAYATFNIMREKMDEVTFVEEYPLIGEAKAFAYQGKEARVYAVWSDEFIQAYKSVSIPVQIKTLRITDIYSGQEGELEVASDYLSLTIRDNPVIVEELVEAPGGFGE